MGPRPDTAMTADEFKAWRERMNYSYVQAAHVLTVTKNAVVAWESGTSPIDGRTAHLCESAELLRTIDSSNFFGSPLQLIRQHHANLATRMEASEKMIPQGRTPRATFEPVPYKAMNGYYVRVTWTNGREQHIDVADPQQPAFNTEEAARAWIANKSGDWLAANARPRLRDFYEKKPL